MLTGAKTGVMEGPADGTAAAAATPSHAHKRVLGVVRFAAVAYFAVAGGPFGIEAAVMHAGPAPCFLGFLALPLLWSLPQALFTAELSTLLPDNGGGVLWVTHAMGDFGGWLVGLNGILGAAIDLTLYPVIFADIINNTFLRAALPPFAATYALRLVVIVVGAGVNVWGVGNVGLLSLFLAAGILLPFVVSLCAQFTAVAAGASAVVQAAGVMDPAVFLATMLWSFTGFDSLGCLAGEVVNPRVTYIAGTTVTLAFVVASYVLPVFVSIATHPDYWNWQQGSLAAHTGDVAPWLGVTCVAFSLACQMGIFTTGLSTNSRAVWALAGGAQVQPALSPPPPPLPPRAPSRFGALSSPPLQPPPPAAPLRRDYTTVVHLPAVLAREWARTGAPVASLGAHVVLVSLMCLLPFDTLVQADIVLACVRLGLEVAAFLRLRELEPPRMRSEEVYTVPGGWWGAAAVAVPQLAIIAFVLATADPVVWLIALVINAVGVAVFAVRVLLDRRASGRWWPRGHCNLRAPSHPPAATAAHATEAARSLEPGSGCAQPPTRPGGGDDAACASGSSSDEFSSGSGSEGQARRRRRRRQAQAVWSDWEADDWQPVAIHSAGGDGGGSGGGGGADDGATLLDGAASGMRHRS